MAKVCPIKVGKFEGFSWIRCEGKGSFLNSPAVKEYGENRIKDGETLLVVDLEECTGMDSTFMGILAGLSTKLSARNGELQIASAGEKSKNSLEDLGLDFFMEINPDEPIWEEVVERVRDLLTSKEADLAAGTKLHTRHVLEAHEILSEANVTNSKKFSSVVGILKGELEDKSEGSE
ncbi:STAS domain-containing protein [Luteolibacter sp. AS25]|uniref:STAS domain-containing protein n=1 Tax=Luteolibacter sp. AS25 TaxID=3135776 RepID=UPI00398AB62F